MEEASISFTCLIGVISLICLIIQILLIVKFFQIARDIHFLRMEYLKLKRIHKVGEYSLAKGDRIYDIGEKLYAVDLQKEVNIVSINPDGTYCCEYESDEVYYPKYEYKNIAGDRLIQKETTDDSTE